DRHDVDGNPITGLQLAGMFEETDRPRLIAYAGRFDPTASDTKLILRAAFDIDTTRRFYDALGIAPTGHTRVVELPSGANVMTEHRQAKISTVLERLAGTGTVSVETFFSELEYIEPRLKVSGIVDD
ncbi:MAG TPA: hypothetical protein VF809_01745, partial [Candidatus Saccharimonadales bacterium]